MRIPNLQGDSANKRGGLVVVSSVVVSSVVVSLVVVVVSSVVSSVVVVVSSAYTTTVTHTVPAPNVLTNTNTDTNTSQAGNLSWERSLLGALGPGGTVRLRSQKGMVHLK